MGLTVTIIVLIISGVALGVAGGFGSNATVRVTELPGYDTSEELQSAHGLMTAASVLTWVSIGLLVLGIILIFVFRGRIFKSADIRNKNTSKGVLYVTLFILLGITVTTGILWILGSNGISSALGDNSANDNDSIGRARIAGGLALGAGLLTLILFIAALFYRSTPAIDARSVALKRRTIAENRLAQSQLQERKSRQIRKAALAAEETEGLQQEIALEKENARLQKQLAELKRTKSDLSAKIEAEESIKE